MKIGNFYFKIFISLNATYTFIEILKVCSTYYWLYKNYQTWSLARHEDVYDWASVSGSTSKESETSMIFVEDMILEYSALSISFTTITVVEVASLPENK